MRYVLAFDVAKNKSLVTFRDETGKELINPYEFVHHKLNFVAIHHRIQCFNLDNITVFMESTAMYHLPVEKFFRSHHYNVLVINPLIAKNYESTIRKTKTDKEDTIKLATIFFKNEFKQNFIHEQIYTDLQYLSRHYNSLSEHLTQFKNRFRELICLIFPEYENIFPNKKIFEKDILNFISMNPHPHDIISKSVSSLSAILTNKDGKIFKRDIKTIETIKKYALNSYPGVDATSSSIIILKQIISQMIALQAEIDSIKILLIEKAKTIKHFKNISSIFGVGELTTALLLAELKDPTRFKTHKELIAYCGLDPGIYQSGKKTSKLSISKRGNKYSRKYLFNICSNMIMLCSQYKKDSPFLKYYKLKKAEGKHYYQCIIALSTKLLRTIYSLCTKDQLYTDIL